MKKLVLLFVSLFAITALQAQWVNDPVNNTFIANTSTDAGEIYLSTDPVSGDTYVQWSQFASNGWVPKVQRLNYAGQPQWDAAGLQPAIEHTLASWSQGFAMVATTDNAVVSCFSTEADHSVAVKINADGTFAWGEAGITLFNGAGGSRTELLAGDDGGVWAMATDMTNTYLCYIDADGTTHPTISINGSNGKSVVFGQMVPAPNGNVFVVYETEQWAYTYYYEKDIHVVGYSKDGTQISDDIQLMSPVVMVGSYIHYVVPDGLGGGYAYIWHSAGAGGSFNTYVFHFNQNGASTIADLNGIPVHSADPDNLYISTSATVDPDSHDLILFYEQTDDYSQTLCKLYMNRITPYGERVWDEGILVLDNGTLPCGGLNIDAFEYGGGFAVTYFKSLGSGSQATVEAQGFDMDGNSLWSTQMSSSSYGKTGCEYSTGFHGGQNIVTWVNSGNGGMYGQNISWDGAMGEVTPPTPPAPCDAPTNFQGEAYYNTTTGSSAAMLSWTAPETQPLHYNLYCEGLKEIIEIDGQYDSYYTDKDSGDYVFKLTAVYEDCESNFAPTPDGEDYLLLEIPNFQSVTENNDETIATITKIYTMNGQLLKETNLESLPSGIYLIQGLTQNGNLVTRKLVNSKR